MPLSRYRRADRARVAQRRHLRPGGQRRELPVAGYRAPVLSAQDLADDALDAPTTTRTAAERTAANDGIAFADAHLGR